VKQVQSRNKVLRSPRVLPMKNTEIKEPTPIPRPDPIPPRDPEPEPGSDPDVIPPLRDPMPDRDPEILPGIDPNPEPMPALPQFAGARYSMTYPRQYTQVISVPIRALLFTAFLFYSVIASAQQAQRPPSRNENKVGGSVERGKYIVESVAMCSQCHTPHTDNGDPDRTQWLAGGALWLKPGPPIADWPLKVPRIAGTPPGTDEEMVTLLTTGIWRDGRRLRPPMPQFRMTREDAQAVVAYLKSLNPAKPSE
jgi:mono/diheme cytochrome c family protein